MHHRRFMTRKEIGPSSALEDFLAMLAAERGAAKNTLDAYRRDLRDAESRLRKRKKLLERAETDDLRTLFSQFSAAGLAPSTAARKRAALREYLQGDGMRSRITQVIARGMDPDKLTRLTLFALNQQPLVLVLP